MKENLVLGVRNFLITTWNISDYKIADPTSLQVVRERISKRDMRERVVLKGSNNPEIDVPAIQNAVD
jgi:hypothetical protein